jgi:hypothetical protein
MSYPKRLPTNAPDLPLSFWEAMEDAKPIDIDVVQDWLGQVTSAEWTDYHSLIDVLVQEVERLRDGGG